MLKLTQRRQLAGEPAGIFLEALQALATRIDMDEKHLKMWFYKGLLPGIRTRMPTGSDNFQLYVMLQHARYFEQLLAEEEEATTSREAAGALNMVVKSLLVWKLMLLTNNQLHRQQIKKLICIRQLRTPPPSTSQPPLHQLPTHLLLLHQLLISQRSSSTSSQ